MRMEKILAFIPARSGSKGLKDKNIKKLNGKPLLSYTIEMAKNSGLFCRIFVSTDSSEYAEIVKNLGYDVPFLRAEPLSSDSASVWDAILEALSYFKKEFNEIYDCVCLLQPTSPLRTSKDIMDSYQIFTLKKADSVVSVSEAEHSPLWCNTLDENKSMENFISPEVKNLPRQNLPKYYRINGAVYWVKTSALKNDLNLYGENSYAYIMSRKNSIDIDDETDFMIAEMLVKMRTKKNREP